MTYIFWDIVCACMHGVSRSITLDRHTKFMSYFWKSLWKKMGNKFNFSSAYHP